MIGGFEYSVTMVITEVLQASRQLNLRLEFGDGRACNGNETRVFSAALSLVSLGYV
jgi:hypothetical protein